MSKRLANMGQRNDVVFVDVAKILIRKNFNYRDTTTPEAVAHIAWLKSRIRIEGIQKPLEVTFDPATEKIYLNDGECRLIAARQLTKEGVSVRVPVIQVKGDEKVLLAKAMTANGALAPSAMEFGNAAQRLRDLGMSDDEIAALVPPHVKMKGVKAAKRYVTDAVDLSNAPVAVKDAVKKGIGGVKVSEAAAVSAVRKHGSEKAAEALTRQAAAASVEGKTEVKREKKTGTLINIGDQLSEMILADDWNVEVIMELARKWKASRV